MGSLIAGFKAIVTKRINATPGTPGQRVWQRNYYEYVIRNQEDLERVREYIANNPVKWLEDYDHTQTAYKALCLRRRLTHFLT